MCVACVMKKLMKKLKFYKSKLPFPFYKNLEGECMVFVI